MAHNSRFASSHLLKNLKRKLQTVENESIVPWKSASVLVGDRVFFYGGIKSMNAFETVYSTETFVLNLRNLFVLFIELTQFLLYR